MSNPDIWEGIPRGIPSIWEHEPTVQGLVYIFIGLATLGVAAAAYFGLTFSPIEAFVTAVAFGAVAIMLMERQLHRRSEARLERAVEDLARLLSTDAKAGQVLSQRVNAIADTNVGSRLDGIEADISVLGTVTRQLAEALAEFEEERRAEGKVLPSYRNSEPDPEPVEDDYIEPLIPEAELRAALDQNRLVFHIEPVVALPSRKPVGYDLVPRLMQDAGGLADAPDFMPRRGGEDLIRRIEALALEEAVTIARRAKTSGQPIRLFVPMSRATIADRKGLDLVLATLVANQAVTSALSFAIAQPQFRALTAVEKRALTDFRKAGAGFVLVNTTSLRFDFAELEGLGFSTARFDANQFLTRPDSFTDFHTADIAPYAKRFQIDLCATGVIDEQQLLSLFEDGIALVQGPHIGRPGPVRADLVIERPREPERRQA